MTQRADHLLGHLRDLQKWRQPVVGGRGAAIPTDSIRGDIASIRRGIERRAERFGNAGEVWSRLVPEPMRSDTRLAGLSGGTLTVVTGSSATSYSLDRLLRGGLAQQIIAATNGKILQVKLRVGALDTP